MTFERDNSEERIVNIKVIGARNYLKSNKTVIEQLSPAGAELARGTVIVVRFGYEESTE